MVPWHEVYGAMAGAVAMPNAAVTNRIEIVAHANYFRDVTCQTLEIRYHRRRKFHRPFFAVDVRAVTFVYEPIGAPVNPSVEPVLSHRLHCRLDHLRLEHTLFDDGQVWLDKHAAIESSNRCGEGQRRDQHFHATRRTAAGNRKLNSRTPHFCDCGTRTLR